MNGCSRANNFMNRKLDCVFPLLLFQNFNSIQMDLDMLQLAECFLRGTGETLLIDPASRSLLEETAAALHALTTEIVQAVASPEVEGMIEDEALKSNLRLATRTTNGASQKTLQQIQVCSFPI